MKSINVNHTVLLKYDPGFVRCGSEQNDSSFLQYRIIKKGERPKNPYDIYEDSDMAASLIGKKAGDSVKVPMEGIDVYLNYKIIEIT